MPLVFFAAIRMAPVLTFVALYFPVHAVIMALMSFVYPVNGMKYAVWELEVFQGNFPNRFRRAFFAPSIPIKAANRRKKKVVNARRKRDKETERETE